MPSKGLYPTVFGMLSKMNILRWGRKRKRLIIKTLVSWVNFGSYRKLCGRQTLVWSNLMLGIRDRHHGQFYVVVLISGEKIIDKSTSLVILWSGGLRQLQSAYISSSKAFQSYDGSEATKTMTTSTSNALTTRLGYPF